MVGRYETVVRSGNWEFGRVSAGDLESNEMKIFRCFCGLASGCRMVLFCIIPGRGANRDGGM
jgi:hypothetical protein